MEPTRRELVQMLAVFGLAGGTSSDGLAQPAQTPALRDIAGAIVLQGREIPAERLERIRPAIGQALDACAPVRAFEIADDVGLPVVFKAGE